MGLDTYAARIPVDVFDPELDETKMDENFGCTRRDLWAFRWAEWKRKHDGGGGSIFAGNYFRGKIYDSFVRCITGVPMHQVWIPPETVRMMADALERWEPEEALRRYRRTKPTREVSSSEVRDLRAFLQDLRRPGARISGVVVTSSPCPHSPGH